MPIVIKPRSSIFVLPRRPPPPLAKFKCVVFALCDGEHADSSGETRENCVRAPLMKREPPPPPLLPWACGAPGPGRTGCGGWARRRPGSGSTVRPAGSRAGSRPCWSARPLSRDPPAADGDRQRVRMDTFLNSARRRRTSCCATFVWLSSVGVQLCSLNVILKGF